MTKPYEEYAIREREPDAKNAVLLVIDMQEYFREMATPILPAIQTAIDLAGKVNMPVMYTMHAHKGPSDYGMLEEWWGGDLVLVGTPGAKIMSDVHKLEVS